MMSNNFNYKDLLPSTDFPLSIDGKLIQTAERAQAINPATGKVLIDHSVANQSLLNEAVAAAKQAFQSWSQVPWSERAKSLVAFADLLEANKEKLMRLLTMEQGKGRAGAEWEIEGSIYWVREIAGQTLPDEYRESAVGGEVKVRHVPLGVVGAITPWNFPVLLAVWKLTPALLTGNTVVLKPSPFTPLCTLWLGELAQKVFPAGVLNIVAGANELGQLMTEHTDIAKISFTGSTATGRRVLASGSNTIKRTTLELGGNDPAIVLPGIKDIKALAEKLFWAAFQNSSQFCLATKRLYVHASIYDEFLAELVKYTQSVKVGNGLDPETQLGPIQNLMQFNKVSNLLADTKKAGLRIVCGGEPATDGSYFIPVTIIDNPPEDARCVVEEAFGPVLPVLKYSNIDDVIARANDTIYGLGGSVWGEDPDQAEKVAVQIQAGMVWINQIHILSPHIPFGGHKQSGVAVENGLEGLSEFTNIQTLMKVPL
jgi:acyl-CoA reductase-like NAD-dependent aldehyde dehydrogenase